jgi:hypothetical protein
MKEKDLDLRGKFYTLADLESRDNKKLKAELIKDN